jgi:hypothetical protein
LLRWQARLQRPGTLRLLLVDDRERVMTDGFVRASIGNILWWLGGFWLLSAVTGGPSWPSLIGSIVMVAWLWRAWVINDRLVAANAAANKAYFASHRETSNEKGE